MVSPEVVSSDGAEGSLPSIGFVSGASGLVSGKLRLVVTDTGRAEELSGMTGL